MIHRTLFKQTSTGATQIWFMESEDGKHRATSGQKNGKKTTSEWTVCKGKNIGKENETSPEEQAVLEVEAQYRKKLAQGGYKETEENIETPNFFKPMLAEKFEDRPITKDQWLQGVFSQPKYDGMRCIVSREGMFSREGKRILSAPHIFEALKPLLDEDPLLIFDGELYNHLLKDDFNEIMSLAKQVKPTKEDLEASKKMLKFYVYDYFSKVCFGSRSLNLEEMLKDCADCIVCVPTVLVHDQKDLDSMMEEYLSNGYEGQIVRHNEAYQNKRTKFLLKRKQWQDQEFEILEFLEGEGNRSGMVGKIKCKIVINGKDDDFKATPIGGIKFYKELWKERDQFVGGTVTVKFFNFTPDGKPRFPSAIKIFKGKRDDI